jgi:hypothetical protein
MAKIKDQRLILVGYQVASKNNVAASFINFRSGVTTKEALQKLSDREDLTKGL